MKSKTSKRLTLLNSKTILSGEIFKENFTDIFQTNLEQVAFFQNSIKNTPIALNIKIGDFLSSGDKIGEEVGQKKNLSFPSGLRGVHTVRAMRTVQSKALRRNTNIFLSSSYKCKALLCNTFYPRPSRLLGLRFVMEGGGRIAKQSFAFNTEGITSTKLGKPAALSDGHIRRFVFATKIWTNTVTNLRQIKRRSSLVVGSVSRNRYKYKAPLCTYNGVLTTNRKFVKKERKNRTASLYSWAWRNGFHRGEIKLSFVQSERHALSKVDTPFSISARKNCSCKQNNERQKRKKKKIPALVKQALSKPKAFKKLAKPIILNSSGRVVTISKTQLILQKTQPVLFYNTANLHVKKGEWIKEGSPILTLTHQTLITGDIVQGIPRIEQLFEAFTSPPPDFREKRTATKFKDVHDTLHSQVRDIFRKHWQESRLPIAVRKSLEEIGYILVEMIQKVYLSQGVLISDKHIEIVIRQLASKGQILDSGTTGLFLEEILPIRQIENANLTTPGKKCLYVPAIMGLTAAALNSDSFISAASFQETTRVLSRDAVVGKSDFLRGLKEKVVIGDLISAGTGLDIYFIYTTVFAT